MEIFGQLFQINPSLIVTFVAMVVMLYCLLQVVALKPKLPGGVIGKTWNLLVGLVVLFTVAYVASPFVEALTDEALRLFVSFIFFFGALYVLITVRLIYRIIRELTA